MRGLSPRKIHSLVGCSPLFTLRDAPRGTPRKTRGRVVRYSFLVRNFHSLLSAGLSRRPRPPFFGVCDFPEGLGGNKKVRCPGSEVRGLEGSGQWRVARNRRGPLAGDANDRLFAPAPIRTLHHLGALPALAKVFDGLWR